MLLISPRLAYAWMISIACSALLQQATANSEATTKTANILFLESAGIYNEFDNSGFGVLPAVEMAVEDVNRNPEVLPGYTLNLLYNRTEDEPNGTTTLSSFFDGLFHPLPPLAIVGAATSVEETTLLARISGYFSLNMVSSITCPTENVEVPSHYCMLPSAEHIVYGIAGFIAQFRWKRAAIITEIDDPLHLDSDTLTQMLKDNNVNVSEVFVKNGTNVSERSDLFVPDVHIFVVNTSPKQARNILFEASRQEIGYPNYVWIIPGSYPDQWWVQDSSSGFTRDEFDAFLRGAIEIANNPMNVEESTVTISGKTNQEFEAEYRMKNGVPPSPYDLYAYDALWTIALALNESNATACINTPHFQDLVQCIRRNGREIQAEIERTDFIGVSGSVSFEQGIRTSDHVRVTQYRRVNDVLTRIQVAHITKLSNALQFVYSENESDGTVWPQGIPPDGTPLEMTNEIPVSLLVVLYLLAVGGIIFAVACMIFNFIFRKHKLIQLTSPRLNYVISIGIILLCAAVFVYAFPPNLSMTSYTAMCSLRSWLASLGYDLSFGTINAKMWRVYYIFCNPQVIKKRAWKDWHLMVVVLIFVLVDVITLTVVTAIPNARATPTLITDEQNPSSINERGVRVDNSVLQCVSDSDTYWNIPLYGYKIVLQVIGVVLALRIRKVEIKGLNDAREVQRVIYITGAIVVTLVVADFVLRTNNITAYAALFGLGLAGGSIILLGFIFIPKMVGLYRDPKGDHIFESKRSSMANNTNNSLNNENANTVAELKRRIQELEMQAQQNMQKETCSGPAALTSASHHA